MYVNVNKYFMKFTVQHTKELWTITVICIEMPWNKKTKVFNQLDLILIWQWAQGFKAKGELLLGCPELKQTDFILNS